MQENNTEQQNENELNLKAVTQELRTLKLTHGTQKKYLDQLQSIVDKITVQLQQESDTTDDADEPKEQENNSALHLSPEKLEQKIRSIIEENKELKSKLDNMELTSIL